MNVCVLNRGNIEGSPLVTRFLVTLSILQLLRALAVTGDNFNLVNLDQLLHLTKLNILEDKGPHVITKTICLKVASLERKKIEFRNELAEE